MDIGQKLRNARKTANFTQESIAEKLNVSRQTISNWENNKSYPDIISVIALSDLYSITLDELLKEDKKMIEYLKESTDAVTSRQNFSKLILIISYLAIWALSIITFWLGGESQDTIGYTLTTFYLVLPITTLVISVFIGKDESWGNYKWLMPLFFGFMYMLAAYCTFSLANMVSFDKFNMPEIEDVLPGLIFSAIGLVTGFAIRKFSKRKEI